MNPRAILKFMYVQLNNHCLRLSTCSRCEYYKKSDYDCVVTSGDFISLPKNSLEFITLAKTYHYSSFTTCATCKFRDSVDLRNETCGFSSFSFKLYKLLCKKRCLELLQKD